MKKLFTLLMLAVFGIAAHAQNELVEGEFQVGDTITIGGVQWLVGPNLIQNPSFDAKPSENGNNIIGWTVGSYAQMTTSNFNWIETGGHDGGAYIQAKGHTGSDGANSVCQRWTLDTQSQYYFSFWLSNNSANNQYIPVVTLTSNESTGGGQNEKLIDGAKQLIGKNGEDSGEILGYGNFLDENSDGYGEWCQTGMTFTSEEYTYLQFNARWLKENKIQACFDDFHLHKLYDPATTKPETIAFISLQSSLEQYNNFMGDELADYYAFQEEASDWLSESGYEDYSEDNTLEEIQNAIKNINEKTSALQGAVANAVTFSALLLEAENLMNKTSENPYPGIEAFSNAYDEFVEYQDNGFYAPSTSELTASEYIVSQIAALNKAMNDYKFSQTASQEEPADYTFLIQSPEFLTSSAEPTYDEQLVPTYPNGDSYTQGSAPSDASSNGWYIGTSGGDQRCNFVQGRACWNAWRNTASFTDLTIAQNLTDIPNGYYTVSALMITQTGCITDQHVFATSTADSQVSPVLTKDTWDSSNSGESTEWDYLTTAQVIVSDGKLTIGATANGSSELPTGGAYTDYRAGWFCVTHFVLKYYGPLDDSALVTIYANKVKTCEDYAEGMGFAADKKAFKDAVAENKGAEGTEAINAALGNINTAYATAQASQAEYEAVLVGSYANLQDSIATSYPENCKLVAQKIVALEKAFLESDTASYKASAAKTAILRYYRDNLLPVLKDCESLAYTNPQAQQCLSANISCVTRDLTAITDFPTTADLDAQIALLKKAVTVCEAEIALAEVGINPGGDMTLFIQNPTIENTSGSRVPDGWAVNMTGSGNNLVTNTGQEYDGGTGYYLDAWHGTAGTLLYTASQQLDNIPNGTYHLSVMARTSSDAGYYVFVKPDNDDNAAKFSMLKLHDFNYTKYYDAQTTSYLGGDSIYKVSDTYGPIWEDAAEYLKANCDIDYQIDQETGYDLYNRILDYKETHSDISDEVLQYLNIASANSGKGRGWQYVDIEFEVTGHKALIGVSTDSTFTKGFKDVDGNDCVPFTGTWVSADNWKLTLVTPGDNTEWSPVTAIDQPEAEIRSEKLGIRSYNLAGQIVDGNFKGVVIRNGKKYLNR